MAAEKRVVVTGLGVVTSVGSGKDVFWNNLIAGQSGITKVTTFDTSNYDMHLGGEVKDFIPEKFIEKKGLKNIARASQFAIAASKMALKDAEISMEDFADDKNTVIIGTTMGEGGMIEEVDKHWTNLGEEDVWAITVLRYPSNAISSNISHVLGANGISCVLPTACAAGNYSIGFGYDMIRKNMVTRAVVGGADPFSRIGYTGFGRL